MKKLNIRFEQDKTLDHIEVVVRSSEKDTDTDRIIGLLSKNTTQKLTLLDSNGCPCIVDEDTVVIVTANGKNVQVMTVNGVYTAKQTMHKRYLGKVCVK